MLTIRKLHLLVFCLLLESCIEGGGGGGDSALVTSTTTTPPSTSTDSQACDTTCESFQTTEYNNQSGLDMINAAQAYSFLTENGLSVAGDGIKIAIVDTGVYGLHDDLLANYDSTNSVGDGSNLDENVHGTHVAGIAAADDDDSGMHGVAPNAEIVGIAFTGVSGVGAGTSDFADVVQSSQSTVVNMSFGSTSSSSSITSQLAKILADSTIGSKVVLVAAAGNSRYSYNTFTDVYSWNSDSDNPSFPAADATDSFANGQMLAVAALNTSSYFLNITFDGNDITSRGFSTLSGDIDQTIAFYSNYCGSAARYCLSAPGGDSDPYSGDSTDYGIFSTYYDATNTPSTTNSYDNLSGTSMAAPHVSGAAAILQAAWPSLTGAEVTQILLETSDYLGCDDLELPSLAGCNETTITGGTGTYAYNDVTGWGALNLSAAVRANGSSDILSTESFSGPTYDLERTSLNISSSLAAKLGNSRIFNKAVFFDIYDRNFKANLSDKISIRTSSRQTIDFDASSSYKNVRLGNNLIMGFVDHTVESDPARLALSSSEEYADYQLNNFSYQVRFNNIAMLLHFSESYQTLGFQNQVRNNTDDIYNFNQEDRVGMQIAMPLRKGYNYQIGFFQDSTDVSEIHNILQMNKEGAEIDWIYSFIDSRENLIGITGNEAFDIGDDNQQHIFGFNLAKNIGADFKLFLEYRHLFGDESNNDLGILRNFRDIEENSISLGFDKKYGDNNLGFSVFVPTAIVKGFVDIDLATGRDESSVIRESETINLSEDDREINYSLSWSRSFAKSNIALNYSYKENFEHDKNAHDQLLFISYSLSIN